MYFKVTIKNFDKHKKFFKLFNLELREYKVSALRKCLGFFDKCSKFSLFRKISILKEYKKFL